MKLIILDKISNHVAKHIKFLCFYHQHRPKRSENRLKRFFLWSKPFHIWNQLNLQDLPPVSYSFSHKRIANYSRSQSMTLHYTLISPFSGCWKHFHKASALRWGSPAPEWFYRCGGFRKSCTNQTKAKKYSPFPFSQSDRHSQLPCSFQRSRNPP